MKKVIKYIIDGLESFSDDSHEEQIKAIRLMFFEGAILKKYFFKKEILKICFLREKL